jgi:hypothetical protein
MLAQEELGAIYFTARRDSQGLQGIGFLVPEGYRSESFHDGKYLSGPDV